jgi:hypothetical protein
MTLLTGTLLAHGRRTVAVALRASGNAQATKRWWSDGRQTPVNRFMKVRIPCTVSIPLYEDVRVNA